MQLHFIPLFLFYVHIIALILLYVNYILHIFN